MAAKTWGALRSASSLPNPVPFVKWVGGKGPLLRELRRHFADVSEDSTYFEPFLGGGAVFFMLRPHNAVLSDLNAPLIQSYIEIRDHLSELTALLAEMPLPVSDSDYYDKRSRFNQLLMEFDQLRVKDRIEISALFIWLNHTCFNGLYRVNKDGLFNAALGDNPETTIYSVSNLRAVRRALLGAHAKILCVDYEEAVKPACRGDVVYLDPPYRSPENHHGFAKYTASGFDTADQERLSEVVHDLVDRGCHVVLSSAHSQHAVALYRDLHQQIVMAPRKVNCDASGRGKVAELLVTARSGNQSPRSVRTERAD